jgi:hypothetical protein
VGLAGADQSNSEMSLLLLLLLLLLESEEEEDENLPPFLFFLLRSLARALEAPTSTPAARAETTRAPTREISSPEEEEEEREEGENLEALLRNFEASASAVATSEARTSSFRWLPQPPPKTTAWRDLARVERQAAEPEAPAAAAAASPRSAPRRARSAGARAAPRARAAAAGGAAAAASTEESISALARHHAASMEGHKCSGGGE